VRFKDLCWPGDPAWGGRLLASLWCPKDPSWGDRYLQLWSLRLDPGGTAIVSAEPLVELDPQRPLGEWFEQRFPTAGASPDGAKLLAVLLRGCGEFDLDLWVARLDESGSGGPRVRAQEARKVAERCAAVEPAFSTDGRWVYATVRGDGDTAASLVRFPVDPAELGAKTPAQSGEAASAQ
jgi:hypothetical protein